MPNITEEFVNSLAPNQNAITNGWGLVKKNSFVNLSITSDGTLLFGECKGSGSSNYACSADFIKPESPVFRCTCPSRQFPCKHALGLMYAYIKGKEFKTGDIPEDIEGKREKVEKREEKKKVETNEPKKVNKSALTKKLKAQLEGLELFEKVINSIVRSGLGTINAKTIKLLEDQAKQLGNYYIPGVQSALRDLIALFKENENHEEIYTQAVDSLIMLNALCKKGREHIARRQESKEIEVDTSTNMEELLGYAWQLSELKELGLYKTDTELVQLMFNSVTSEGRQEYVDFGVWIDLKSGELYETYNYRPFKAAKYIREDDSFFSVLNVNELYYYPGEFNKRVRWEKSTVREIERGEFSLIKSYAKKSFADVSKSVKNQIKNPLYNKFPIALLKFSRIGKIDELNVIEDESGQRLILEDNYISIEPESVELLKLLTPDKLKDNAMLVRFHNNIETKKLCVQPLSIITDDEVIRLIY